MKMIKMHLNHIISNMSELQVRDHCYYTVKFRGAAPKQNSSSVS